MADPSKRNTLDEVMNIHSIPFDFESFVTIEIGEESPQKYVVPKDLICHYSSYFKSAFKESFIEGSEHRIHLHEFETHTFDTFVRWLYSQALPIWFDDMEAAEHRDLVHDWCLLYVFADFAGVPKLRRDLVHEYLDWLKDDGVEHSRCPNKTAAYVYLNTHSTSPLRRLVVDDYYSTAFLNPATGALREIESEDELFPSRFWLDLMHRHEKAREVNVLRQMEYKDYYDGEIKKLLHGSMGVGQQNRKEKAADTTTVGADWDAGSQHVVAMHSIRHG